MLLFVVFVVVWVGLVGVWIAAIVSASRYSQFAYRAAGRSHGSTVALVVVTGWVGAAYYWLVIRREVEPYRNAPPDDGSALT